MKTVFELFQQTATGHPDNPFLCIPPMAGRDYHSDGCLINYAEALGSVMELRAVYAASGYGVGHRVALMLDNQPEHFLHMLALNSLGVSQVPVNPFYLHHELLFQMTHSEVDLAVCLPKHLDRLQAVALERDKPLPVVSCDEFSVGLVTPLEPAREDVPGSATEAAIIYTSGTTGQPKGCLLDNAYHLAVGHWYANLGGNLTLEFGCERVYVPLPVFHVNAGINTPTALIMTANCLIMPDSFHPQIWWSDLVTTKATGCHYLGVVPPLLLKAPVCPEEKQHAVKFGLGAGLDPDLHHKFEERFGIPMVEVWGMTETGRFLANAYEPRQVETRAFGRPTEKYLAKVVDEQDNEVPRGTQGELVVCWAGDDPRAGFFRGYFKDEKATEEAWRGGWFHTGDVVTQADDDMLYFVERAKNIIRRSGENISAAEVENGLIDHPAVAQLAVISVADELRDEEVMACVMITDGYSAEEKTAIAIQDYGRNRLAWFKLPGWIVFVDNLPRTGTQKVQKQLIFEDGIDPCKHAGAVDLRPRKRRDFVSGSPP